MDRFEYLFPAGSGEQSGPVLRGTGASAGQVTAPARVLGRPGRLRPDAARRRARREHHHARRGRRCSRWPPPSSPTSAGRCRTARSSRGSTASPPSSAPAWPPGGSRTARRCGRRGRGHGHPARRGPTAPWSPPRSRRRRRGPRLVAGRCGAGPRHSGGGGFTWNRAIDALLAPDNDHERNPRRSGCMILINVKFPVRARQDGRVAGARRLLRQGRQRRGGLRLLRVRAQPGRPEPVHLRRGSSATREAGGAHVKHRARQELLRPAPYLVSAQPQIVYIDSPDFTGWGPMGEIQPEVTGPMSPGAHGGPPFRYIRKPEGERREPAEGRVTGRVGGRPHGAAGRREGPHPRA